jgi:DNA invertase Pin-like site-specific DNA recombinase
MSTEHQRYSLENQAAAISEYASRHGYEVVGSYADPDAVG